MGPLERAGSGHVLTDAMRDEAGPCHSFDGQPVTGIMSRPSAAQHAGDVGLSHGIEPVVAAKGG